MKKKNGIYLTLGIFFVVLVGCSIYYFSSLAGNDKYLDAFNQDEDNQSNNNESNNMNNDDNDLDAFNQDEDNQSNNNESNNMNNDDNDLELNDDGNNNLNTDNQDDNNDIYVDEDSNDNNIDDSSINNESNYFKDLSINDFVSLVDDKEDFILVISQTWCSHCTNYKPKVEKVANNNKVVVYYIEYNMLSENDKNVFNGYVEFLGTPTTVFFKDGVEVVDARINGDTSEDRIESVFRDNGYIK